MTAAQVSRPGCSPCVAASAWCAQASGIARILQCPSLDSLLGTLGHHSPPSRAGLRECYITLFVLLKIPYNPLLSMHIYRLHSTEDSKSECKILSPVTGIVGHTSSYGSIWLVHQLNVGSMLVLHYVTNDARGT